MPSDTERTVARLVDMTTGETTLRTFSHAAEARQTLGRELGRPLVWEREEEDWVARYKQTEYRVPADAPGE